MSIGVKNRGSGENVTPEVTAQAAIIDQIMTALVGKVQGANATADKILAGYKAYVGQQLVEGTYEPITGIDFGEVTLSAASTTFQVNHGLGTTPSLIFALAKNGTSSSYLHAIIHPFTYNGSVASLGLQWTNETPAFLTNASNESLIKFTSSKSFESGTYHWIALGGGSN